MLLLLYNLTFNDVDGSHKCAIGEYRSTSEDVGNSSVLNISISYSGAQLDSIDNTHTYQSH